MNGENLRYYRLMLGLTQRDVALSAGVKPSVIGKIEVHNTDVKLSTAIKIANSLDIKVEDLVSKITREQWEHATKTNANIRHARRKAVEDIKRQFRDSFNSSKKRKRGTNATA